MKSEYKKPLLRCRLGHIILGDLPGMFTYCALGRTEYKNRCEQCEYHHVPMLLDRPSKREDKMSDIEQAIDYLKDPIGKYDIHDKAVDLAVKALEKQIPKKPIRSPWSISKCPSCNAELGEQLEDGYCKDWENTKICECGQKLDWSVDE